VPELRKDPITGRWVIIATDRAKRPNDFIRQPVPPAQTGVCPFDAGHENKTPPEVLAYRDGGGRDQPGWRVRVVPNKFPVLGIEGALNRQGEGMYDKMSGIGANEVIIETPDHSATLSDMPEHQIAEVLRAFRTASTTSSATGDSATSSCSATTARRPALRSNIRIRN